MVTALAELDAPAVRRWFEHALRSLLLVRHEIDRLNVFPVPDADTGTNLVLTLAGAAEAVRPLGPDADLTTLTRAAAEGALLGARGNSGVIVGQCLHALAGALADRPDAGPAEIAAALGAAANQARDAVSRPVEGTILTVARAAADAAARAADGGGSLEAVVRDAGLAARDALAETRGAFGGTCVDAGGVGYVVLLTALLDVVTATGDAGAARAERVTTFLARLAGAAAGPAGAAGTAQEPGAGAFEVMYVLRAGEDRARAVRDALERTGHSVAVVGGDDLWQVHVHTDEPAAALARPTEMSQVCVRLVRRHTSRVGVVACTSAPGLLEHLARAGATAVLGADPPSVLRAATDTGAAEVLVLPNDASSAAAARAAARHDGRSAPHRSRPVELEVAPATDDLRVLTAVTEMTVATDLQLARRLTDEAALRVRVRAVPRTGDGAVQDSLAGLLEPGDELLTAVLGAGAAAGTAAEVRAAAAALAPALEIVVVDGGQPSPALLLGVE